MGWYVHLHVCFSCNYNEPVAAVAKKCLEAISDDRDGAREATWFLRDLSERTGQNPGPKGGLSLWGITGNYTNVEKFIDTLQPFWLEMFRTEAGGLLNFEHVIVFEEQEQSEKTIAHEISYDDKTDCLKVVRHECPFAFMQM